MIDSVRIGAVEYTVEEREPEEMLLEGHAGECSAFRARIHLAKGAPRPVMAGVLVHEVLHALIDDAGIELGSKEELVVNAIAPRLTAFLADNRGAIEELWQWLGVE